ncbi:MAG: Fic family protein [Crocinitomicaceae bacterium]|nr:Fic family protein [Crocinitomicaceae bacterium]
MKILLKTQRKKIGLKSRELAQLIGVDQALISKFENGERIPTEEQVKRLEHALNIQNSQLTILWLKEKILNEINQNPYASSALQLVQEEIESYSKQSKIELAEDIHNLLNEINVLKAKLDNIRQMDSYRITEALELEYTFESNRIEGNTLTLQETDLVVNEGLTISGKSMREHLEAVNHNEAIEYIKDLMKRNIDINEREILIIHNLILRGIMPEYAGKYRDVQVMIKGSSHMPPQPYLVQKQMEELVDWYKQNKKNIHPVVLAAEMHERLVTIHPFIDGNGRTSRLLMNLILLSSGFVIANIKGDNESRRAYYQALENVQVNDSKDAFIRFVALVEKQCLERYLSILV